MTKPLALVFYENLLPGSQLINRLQDLGYRVLSFHDGYLLEDQAERELPLVIVTDLFSKRDDVCGAIKKLRNNPKTKHIPVLAFIAQENAELQQRAHAAGANLIANASGILEQLPQLLAQVLEVE
jgi:CheY-like chemotaxis protein